MADSLSDDAGAFSTMGDVVFPTDCGRPWEDAVLDFEETEGPFPGTAQDIDNASERGMQYSPSPQPHDFSCSFSEPMDTTVDRILSSNMWEPSSGENAMLPAALSRSWSVSSSLAGDDMVDTAAVNHAHVALASCCDGATGGSPEVTEGELVTGFHVDGPSEPMQFPSKKQPSSDRKQMRKKVYTSRVDPSVARASRSHRRAARREVAARRRALLEQALRLAGEDVTKYPLLHPSGWVLDPEAAIPVTDSHGERDDSSVSGGSGSGGSGSASSATGSGSVADDGLGMPGEESSDPKVRRQARLARNRASACRSRQRKKQEVDSLKKQLAAKEEECQRLRAENYKLQRALHGHPIHGDGAEQQYSPLSTGSASTVSPLSLPHSQLRARPRRSKRPRVPKERYSPDEGKGIWGDSDDDNCSNNDEANVEPAFDPQEDAPTPPSSKRRRIGGRRGLPMLAMALALMACAIAVLQEVGGLTGDMGVSGAGEAARRFGGERKLFAMDPGPAQHHDHNDEPQAGRALNRNPLLEAFHSGSAPWTSPLGFVLMATGARELAMAALLVFLGVALVAVLIAWIGSEDEVVEETRHLGKRARGHLWNPAYWLTG